MRKLFTFFAIIAVSVAMVSCDEETDGMDDLSLGTMQVQIGTEAAETFVCGFIDMQDGGAIQIMGQFVSKDSTEYKSMTIMYDDWMKTAPLSAKSYSTEKEADMIGASYMQMKGQSHIFLYCDSAKKANVIVTFTTVSAAELKGSFSGKMINQTTDALVDIKGSFWAKKATIEQTK